MQVISLQTDDNDTVKWVFPSNYSSPPRVFVSIQTNLDTIYFIREVTPLSVTVVVRQIKQLPTELSKIMKFSVLGKLDYPVQVNLLAI